MCNNCIHKIVCSKYIATGGVNKCEHFKEDRKGRWDLQRYYGGIRKGMVARVICSECGYPNEETNYCPNCGADMRGDQCE